MNLELQTTSVDEIADAVRRNLRGESTPTFPLPASYARVSEVQLWINRWEKAAGADRQLLEDAIELAVVEALEGDDREVIPGALRLLRRVRRNTIPRRGVRKRTREALVSAADAGRFKKVDSAYGDLHAELLACIGNLRVKADDCSFWAAQMNAPEYVASAVSGCLDSGSLEVALQGVILATKKQDPTLPFSLDRLFRLHHPNEHAVWIRFLSAYRSGHWTDEDWARMAKAAAVFDRVAPDRNTPIEALSCRATRSGDQGPSEPTLLPLGVVRFSRSERHEGEI